MIRRRSSPSIDDWTSFSRLTIYATCIPAWVVQSKYHLRAGQSFLATYCCHWIGTQINIPPAAADHRQLVHHRRRRRPPPAWLPAGAATAWCAHAAPNQFPAHTHAHPRNPLPPPGAHRPCPKQGGPAAVVVAAAQVQFAAGGGGTGQRLPADPPRCLLIAAHSACESQCWRPFGLKTERICRQSRSETSRRAWKTRKARKIAAEEI